MADSVLFNEKRQPLAEARVPPHRLSPAGLTPGSTRIRTPALRLNKYLRLSFSLLGLGLVGGGLIVSGVSLPQAAFLGLVAIFTAMVAVVVFYRWRQEEFNWFEPGVFAGVLYLLVFGYLGVRYMMEPSLLHPLLQGDTGWIVLALLYVLLGLVAFWVGYYSRLGLLLRQLFRRRGREAIQDRATVRPAAVALLYGVGLVTRFYMLQAGLYGYLRDTERFAGHSYGFALVMVETFTSYALVLAWLDYLGHRHWLGRRLLAWGLLLSEIVWGFFSGMKANILVPLFFIAIAYSFLRGRRPLRHLLAIVLGLVLIFPVTNLYRFMVRSGELQVSGMLDLLASAPVIFNEVLVSFEDPNLYLEAGYDYTVQRSSLIQNYALMLRYLDTTGAYWQGRYLWMLPALIVVPRAVWPDKPQLNLGYWFAVNVWGQDPHIVNAITPTYLGDLHLQFGLPAVLVGMFLTGVLLRWVYERYGRPCSSYSLFLYVFLFYRLVDPQHDVVFRFAGLAKEFVLLLLLSLVVFRYRRPLRLPSGDLSQDEAAAPCRR